MMGLEATAYLILLIYMLAIAAYKIEVKLFFVSSWSLFIIYSLVVRTSGFDEDIAVYETLVSYNVSMQALYVLREPAFWFGMKFIDGYTSDFLWTLFIVDQIAFLLVFFGMRRIDAPQYLTILFFLSFPSFLGMQNVYRQFLATVVLFSVLSFAMNEQKRRFIYFVIASGLHNVAAVFLPILFIFRTSKINNLWVLPIIMFSGAMLVLFAGSKSSIATGNDLRGIYLAMIAMMLIFSVLSTKLKIAAEGKKDVLFLCFLLVMGMIGIGALGAAQAERIMMVAVILAFPGMANIIERYYKDPLALRYGFIAVFVAPVWIFSSSRAFLDAQF